MKLASKLNNLTKYEKYALITIAIAIILRFSLIGTYAVSGDACWHLSAARFMADNLKIPLFDGVGRDEPFWPPPLFHFIAAAFYLVLGELGLKLVSPLFGSLTLIVSYFLFRKMLNEKQSFYAVFFLSFIPLYIDYNVLGYVESVLTFLFAIGIYLALEKRFFLAGTAAGLAMLTKNNGIFLIPVLVYIAWKKGSKNMLRNLFFVAILPGIIASPWLIRNWINMGNPIWPFMNNIFHGIDMHSYLDFAAENVISKGTYLALYLGFFGVPDGNYNALFFANLPNFTLLLGIYILATIIFLMPLLFGFGKGKPNTIWYVLLASFVPLFFLYVSNVGAFVSRMLMPAFLGLAFFYGIGMERIANKLKTGKILFLLLIIICAGFIGTEAFKFKLARQSWDFYQKDFEWVKGNTQKNDLIMAGGQCMSFYLDRLQAWPKQENLAKARYAFVNQEFAVDRLRAKTPEGVLGAIRKKGALVYANQETKTEIYSFRD